MTKIVTPPIRPFRSIPAGTGGVIGFCLISYYLLPQSQFRLVAPGWWFMYHLRPATLASGYLAAALYCVSTILLVAFMVARHRPLSGNSRGSSFEFPPWLPIIALFIPIIIPLMDLRHNADIAPALCCTMLAISTGIFAALIARSARIAIITLLVLVVIQTGYALYFRSLLGNVLLSGSLWREGGTFSDPEALSVLAVTGAALAVVMFKFLQKEQDGLLYGVAAAAALAALLVTWSRGGAISLSLALVWFSIKYVPQKSVRATIIVCMCFFAAFVIVQRSAGHLNSVSAHQSAVNRVAIWAQGAREFKDHWLTGVGVGTVTIRILAPTSTSNGKSILQSVPGPQNVILFFMAELGIVGLIIIVLAFNCVRRMLKPGGETLAPESIALSTAWLALVLYSFVGTIFGGPGQSSGNAIVGYLYGATLLLGAQRTPQLETDLAIGTAPDCPMLITTTSEEVPDLELGDRSRKASMAAYAPAIVLIGIAMVFAGLALRNHLRQTNTVPSAVVPQLNASALLNGRFQFQGVAEAPYTLVEFGDYECPPCRHTQPLVEAALKQYSGQVKLDFRQLPLTSIHPHAEAAAVAAESGRRAGKFWMLHDRLYSADLSRSGAVSEILTQCGVALDTEVAKFQLAEDAALEKKLAVNSTPSFFLCCPDGSVLHLQGIESLGANLR